MTRTLAFVGILVLAVASTGCAITDYDGIPDHQTQAEAKLWGQEISFITGDPTLDGTYAYTVRYDNRGGRDTNLRIHTYRNEVPDSFSRDGLVDRDGDDVQGSSGVLGGKFLPQWTVTDPAADCQFFLNPIQSHRGAGEPLASLCATVNEEIDKDLDLQASFSSFGDLISQIWSGAVTGGFSAEITGVRLGGANVPLANALSVGATSNGTRPTRITVDLTTPGGRDLLRAIVNNTTDGVPVPVGLSFAGGMTVDLPANVKVAFNHDALWGLLQ